MGSVIVKIEIVFVFFIGILYIFLSFLPVFSEKIKTFERERKPLKKNS